MTNTIRAAKNTFGGGLVMDLSPDNTPNEVLTSALNATLATFNGNELQLQNDMGNGRVETARLPEGYIPVGTCEFGDIIYIVSYNPLTNKSQIGCFPSPERNISSEETGGTNQQLTANDFQELDSNAKPTGRLVASSVKKILYNNKLYPGDKFIIYEKGDHITSNMDNITDVGNTSHQYGAFPKLLRIHVIAIEDSGKINYLDSTLRWYDKKLRRVGNASQPADYFINKTNGGDAAGVVDIDAYKNLLSSGYSVFQSKISGKLALLIELEKITGFSCSYNIYGGEESKGTNTETEGEEETGETNANTDITYKNYKIYWNASWETDDPNINPSYVVLTKSEWSGKDSAKAGKWFKWKQKENNQYELDEKDNEGKIKGESMPALPACYDENGYKYWTIGMTYGSNDISGRSTYDIFVGNESQGNSYEFVLNQFLKALYESQEYYKDVPLTKLNIARDTNYLPELHNYYINATRLEYVGDEATIYTQLPNSGQYQKIEKVEIPDFIVNNYFHQPIYLQEVTVVEGTTKVQNSVDFEIPIKQEITKTTQTPSENSNDVEVNTEIIGELVPDITNLIYHYELTPAMKYGLLSEYAIEGYIDFSKVGTGYVNLTAWKYFVGENAFTLTLGLDAYVEDNMGIEEVVLEFYDNQPEIAAAYHLGNKESYSGQFTEVIPLNGSANTYKLQDIDAFNQQHHHLGNIASTGDTPVYKLATVDNKDVIQEANWENDKNSTLYLNDCGTLYSNMLYLVRIVVKYCPLNALGEYDSTATSSYKYFYRWVWTTTMYNQYYHNTIDFDVLPLTLTLDVLPQYSTTSQYFYGTFNYSSTNSKVMEKASDIYQYLSANVQVVTSMDDVDFDKLTEDSGEVVDPLQLYINLTITNSTGEDIIISGENAVFVNDNRIWINAKNRSKDCANFFIANGDSITFEYADLEYMAKGLTNSDVYAMDDDQTRYNSDANHKPEVYTIIKNPSSSIGTMYIADPLSGNLFKIGSESSPAQCTIVVSDISGSSEVDQCVEFTYSNPSFSVDGFMISFPGCTVKSVDLSKIHINYQSLNSDGTDVEGENDRRLTGQTAATSVSGAEYTVFGIGEQSLRFELDSTLAHKNNGSYVLVIYFEEGAIVTDHGKSGKIPGGSAAALTHKFVNGITQ